MWKRSGAKNRNPEVTWAKGIQGNKILFNLDQFGFNQPNAIQVSKPWKSLESNFFVLGLKRQFSTNRQKFCIHRMSQVLIIYPNISQYISQLFHIYHSNPSYNWYLLGHGPAWPCLRKAYQQLWNEKIGLELLTKCRAVAARPVGKLAEGGPQLRKKHGENRRKTIGKPGKPSGNHEKP